ncbi:3-oxoacyl-[acyl-carrier-protein] synthase III C-terminal domain-containing protein [Nocardia sp. alder85J]|uniref:3-oxoacyl-[acyl-carrier-protein] synthase III C-terminal domain-containing protein n=1 Tax=Nocardia sp. alder85J TaxID=2862949 RepID=UPI001CD45038|nr:3-oxoacyl-[acyl-carrier-protein] synthase III C-terminal domain-containing protein [Nocardia sp. alder85J]MCX4091475.1 3-oxoacyl-ACP synthase [Nocardia sp. alder85J]
MTVTMIDPALLGIAAELPRSAYSTDELLDAGQGHLSGRLAEMLGSLGVENRHSILTNYPEVLFRGAEPEIGIPVVDLAVRAARRCLAGTPEPVESIGLVLGVSSSPGRLVPSLVCDMFARMPELPRTAQNLSIEYMGCSAMAKAIDTARWYLACHPGKTVLVCFAEATTPLSPPLPGFHRHFLELPPEQRQEAVNALHGFLFADAAVAMLLGAEGDGPRFGPVSNLTNALPEDAELGTVPDGGSDVPVVDGRRGYTLSPLVTPRGAYYARETVKMALADETCRLATPAEASALLVHTGSVRILDALCTEFGVAPGDETVVSSYRVLRDYGNTLGCSVPLMLTDPVRRPAGQGLLVAFGLSFGCGVFTMTVPDGGWTPQP